MSYVIKTKVVKVEKKSRVLRAHKIGDVVEQEIEELGWFVLLEHSHEYLYLGTEEPSLKPGQRIRIRIEADD